MLAPPAAAATATAAAHEHKKTHSVVFTTHLLDFLGKCFIVECFYRFLFRGRGMVPKDVDRKHVLM